MLDSLNIGPSHPSWIPCEDGSKHSTQVRVYDENGHLIAHFTGLMAKVNAQAFMAMMNQCLLLEQILQKESRENG